MKQKKIFSKYSLEKVKKRKNKSSWDYTNFHIIEKQRETRNSCVSKTISSIQESNYEETEQGLYFLEKSRNPYESKRGTGEIKTKLAKNESNLSTFSKIHHVSQLKDFRMKMTSPCNKQNYIYDAFKKFPMTTTN